MDTIQSPNVRRGVVLLVLLLVAQLSAPFFAEASSMPDSPAATLERARSLEVAGRFDEAKREYAQVAREQRRLGNLPVEALWRLAEVNHGQGRTRVAAQTLKRLAYEASFHAEPAIQARALLEATLLFVAIGAHDEVRTTVRQLEPLRHSSRIPPELREAIARRLGIA